MSRYWTFFSQISRAAQVRFLTGLALDREPRPGAGTTDQWRSTCRTAHDGAALLFRTN